MWKKCLPFEKCCFVGKGLVSKHFTVRSTTPVVFKACNKYNLIWVHYITLQYITLPWQQRAGILDAVSSSYTAVVQCRKLWKCMLSDCAISWWQVRQNINNINRLATATEQWDRYFTGCVNMKHPVGVSTHYQTWWWEEAQWPAVCFLTEISAHLLACSATYD